MQVGFSTIWLELQLQNFATAIIITCTFAIIALAGKKKAHTNLQISFTNNNYIVEKCDTSHDT